MTGTIFSDEQGRLAALHRYQLLDNGKSPAFEEITRLVQLALDVPVSAVSLIDQDEQRFKAIRGMPDGAVPREAAFCNETIKTAAPLVVPDATRDSRFSDNFQVTGERHIRSYIGVPLTTPDGYNVGALCAIDTRPRQFDERQIAILSGLGKLVVEQFELRQIAKQDYLTGALARRGFQHEVEREYIRSSRYERPAALVCIDIDHFKKINDAFGHPAGDEALRAVAQACLSVMRQSDIFGRIGGEEFAFLLPETTAHEAMQCAERIREVIENLRFKIGERVLSVTASFGVATLAPTTRGAADWFADADRALYEAKRQGRNCSVLATPEPSSPAPATGEPEVPDRQRQVH